VDVFDKMVVASTIRYCRLAASRGCHFSVKVQRGQCRALGDGVDSFPVKLLLRPGATAKSWPFLAVHVGGSIHRRYGVVGVIFGIGILDIELSVLGFLKSNERVLNGPACSSFLIRHSVMYSLSSSACNRA